MDLAAIIQAIKARLRGSTLPDTSQLGAEEISKVLPSAVMPREAVLQKRQQLASIDQMLKESER